MSIKFNVIQKGTPGIVGGGEKKFYASIAMNDEVTIDAMVPKTTRGFVPNHTWFFLTLSEL